MLRQCLSTAETGLLRRSAACPNPDGAVFQFGNLASRIERIVRHTIDGRFVETERNEHGAFGGVLIGPGIERDFSPA